jgi:hypothetical protein
MPARKPKPQPDDPEQYRRFVDMAREVEADETPEALDRAFNKVVPHQSSPPQSAAQNRRSQKPVGRKSVQKMAATSPPS